MRNTRINKYIAIAGCILLVAGVLYFFAGEVLGNPIRIRFSLWLHKQEYNEMAQKFLTQDHIRNIASNANSHIINNCGNHPDSHSNGEWSCTKGDYPNQTIVKLKDKAEVLDYLDVPEEQYSYYSDFLHKHHLDGLGKDEKERYVELEDGLEGLRYYEKVDATTFEPDNEYLSVKKVDDHWFTYTRDWN